MYSLKECVKQWKYDHKVTDNLISIIYIYIWRFNLEHAIACCKNCSMHIVSRQCLNAFCANRVVIDTKRWNAFHSRIGANAVFLSRCACSLVAHGVALARLLPMLAALLYTSCYKCTIALNLWGSYSLGESFHWMLRWWIRKASNNEE